MPDSYVKRTGEEYAESFAALLPTGPAWPREPESVLMRVVRALNDIWGYVAQRADDLLTRESDPRQTVEMLPDWERAFGLPDECTAEPLTIGDRQATLVQRMTTEGGQSRAFFIAVAAQLGYVVTITEYAPFMAGVSRAGDTRDASGQYRWRVGPPEMRFYWTVHVAAVRLTWFRAGKGQAGVDHHLEIALATDLECLIRRWAPAHTEVIFSYELAGISDPMAGTP